MYNSRIFEWKPEKPRNYRPISDCTIVMKNMFTLEQMMVCFFVKIRSVIGSLSVIIIIYKAELFVLQKNAALLLDLEEEIRKVCERFGTVKKVVVHDVNLP